jgi:hypothetical protein
MRDNDRLKLSTEPDGFGFYYGWAERDGGRGRVDVLPPDHLWRGDIKLEGQKPDPKAWVLYLNGEEFAPRRAPRGPAGGVGHRGPRSRGLLITRARAAGRAM